MGEERATRCAMAAVRGLGIRLAIYDYGTGHYLQVRCMQIAPDVNRQV